MKKTRTMYFMAQINDKQIARLESVAVALQGLVEELRGKSSELTPELLKRIEKFSEENRCLYCELPLDGKVTMGCHAACYVLLTRRISNGETTRAAVVSKGWLDPRGKPPGRKPQRPDPMRGRAIKNRDEVAPENKETPDQKHQRLAKEKGNKSPAK